MKMQLPVKFADYTDAELPHVEAIVSRASRMFKQADNPRSGMEIRMDLAAVHASCPLDLQRFAEADDFNFAHDIGGIYRHLDRSTGELTDCFLPRCAAKGR